MSTQTGRPGWAVAFFWLAAILAAILFIAGRAFENGSPTRTWLDCGAFLATIAATFSADRAINFGETRTRYFVFVFVVLAALGLLLAIVRPVPFELLAIFWGCAALIGIGYWAYMNLDPIGRGEAGKKPGYFSRRRRAADFPPRPKR